MTWAHLHLGGMLLLAAACQRADPPAQPAAGGALLVHFEPAQAYEYGCTLHSELAYGAGERLAIDLRGTLRLQEVRTGGATAQAFEVSPRDVHFVNAAPTSEPQFAELAAELERGFSVELAEGRVVAVATPQAASPFAANIVRSLAAAFELPAFGASAVVRSSGEDAAGKYTLEFSRSGQRYAKHKLGYDGHQLAAPTGSFSLALVPRVISSDGVLVLRDGVPTSYSYEEQLETQLGTSSRASARTQLSLTLRSQARTDTVAHLHAAPLPAAAPQLVRVDRGALDASKAEGFTFDSALGELAQQQAKGEALGLDSHNRAFSALSALLRTQPENVSRAKAAALQGSALATLLIDALAAADSEPAQAALFSLARGLELAVPLRAKAVHALSRVETPTRATIEGLIALLDDAAVRLYALYGLGTQSRRLRDRGEGELAARAGERLVTELTQATDFEATVHALRGLANSGYAPALAHVRPLLASDDETLRGAAVEGLRMMVDPQVDALIATTLRADASPFVVTSALNAAKVRTPSHELIRAVVGVAAGNSDDHVRYAAIALLTRWLPAAPELRASLDQIASADRVPALRAAARAAL